MTCCSNTNAIIVVKGDDTDFNDQKFLTIRLTSEIWDLSELSATFTLCGITKTYQDISSGIIEVVYSAAETSKIPYGKQRGILKVYKNGKQATVDNLIPFEFISLVHGNAIATEPFNYTINVEQGGENVLNIDVSAGVVYHNFLLGRGEDDCHPISAITGLQEALDNAGQVKDVEVDGQSVVNEDGVAQIDLSGKQDVIQDLDEIRAGAEAGATALQKSDITTGSENGTISVDGDDIAVSGLGSAAYTDTDDYATAEQGALADTAVQPGDLATVATSGSYNDLLNKPTIGNATLTIKKNGTTVDTFTANATSNKEIDITVPTQPSDIGAATAAQGAKADTALQPDDVINNTSSNDTDKPLSAAMGKSLQDQVNNVSARGRYLALWNCATGLAQSNPQQSPYTYKTGDYFIIGTIATGGGTNYRPTGSSYTTGVASTVVETEDVAVNDVYYYDGTNWSLQINTQKEVSFGSIAGNPYDNTDLASALNAKQNELTEGSGIDITNDTISNSGVRSVSTGATNGTISVNTNGTSAEVSVYGLDSAAYTPTTDYATAAQGSKADTAVQPAELNNYLPISGGNITGDLSVKTNLHVGDNLIKIPDEYTLYDYVQTNNQAYFNTGYRGNNDSEYEIEFEYLSMSSSGFVYPAILGDRTTSSAQIALTPADRVNGSGNSNNRWASLAKSWQKASGIAAGYTYHAIMNKTALTVTSDDDPSIAVFRLAFNNSTTFTTGSNITIGYINNTDFRSNIKIKNVMIIRENGVEVRRYYPVKRNSDGEFGLYDVINNTFLTKNPGAGSITGGNVRTNQYTINASETNAIVLSEDGSIEIKNPPSSDDKSNKIATTKNVRENLDLKYDRAGGNVLGDVYFDNNGYFKYDYTSTPTLPSGSFCEYTEVQSGVTPIYAMYNLNPAISADSTVYIKSSVNYGETGYIITSGTNGGLDITKIGDQLASWNSGTVTQSISYIYPGYKYVGSSTIEATPNAVKIYEIFVVNSSGVVTHHWLPWNNGSSTNNGFYDIINNAGAFINTSGPTYKFGPNVTGMREALLGTMNSLDFHIVSANQKRMTFGKDGSVKLTTSPSSGATGTDVVTAEWIANKGYLTGITSSDVTTALGYTPYSSSNPSGYQANVIETVKVNGTALTPSNKSVDITVPTTMTGSDGTNAGTSGLAPAPAATDNTKFLRGDATWADALTNTATGNNSLTVGGTASTTSNNVNIGVSSTIGTYSYGNTVVGYFANSYGQYGVAVGSGAAVSKTHGISIGQGATSSGKGAIQIGKGTNSTDGTLQVTLTTDGTNFTDYQFLDSSGEIPSGRYKAFVGADGTNAGTKGVVPAPTATDNTKFLSGDGTWEDVAQNLQNAPTSSTPARYVGQIYKTALGDTYICDSINTVEVNGTIVDNPEIVNGVFTGRFSGATPYIDSGVTLGVSTNYEIITKVFTSKDRYNVAYLLSGSGSLSSSSRRCIQLVPSGATGGTLRIFTAWTGSTASSALDADCWYWLKLSYNGTQTTLDYIKDNQYTLSTLPSTGWTSGTSMTGNIFGGETIRFAPFAYQTECAMDFNGVQIKDNDSIVYTGVSTALTPTYSWSLVGNVVNTAQFNKYGISIGSKNNAPRLTASSGISIGTNSTASTSDCVAVGRNTIASATSALAIGYGAQGTGTVAVGVLGQAKAAGAIMIGYGENNDTKTFKVALNDTTTRATDEASGLYELLDATGKIPAGRLTISTAVSSASTNAEVVGSKLFYDTCGDIETLINAL